MTTRPRIAILAASESSASVLYGLYDVLLSVGAMYPDMTTGQAADALLDVFIVAARAEPFRCFGNVLVEPAAAVTEVDAVDVVVVADMYTPIDTPPPEGKFTLEIDWLRRMHDGGALISSVCTGSVLVAAAGLLDGRTCASHWAYLDLFRSAYPEVRLQPETILDLASERDGVITAGGVTAWQDLALHLIKRLCGPEHASRTAKVYLLGGHEDGQLPFAAPTSRAVGDGVIRRTLAWIEDNYPAANPVSAMADLSGLNRRTFARRFVAATGRRPIEHVHSLRIDKARELIELTGLPTDDVGYRVGYEDPAFFRRLFRRTTGLTPAAYRRKYAGIVGAPPTAEASDRGTVVAARS